MSLCESKQLLPASGLDDHMIEFALDVSPPWDLASQV